MQTKKLTTAALLTTMGFILSPILRIPGMCPIQHFINIVSGVLLGPIYAFFIAMSISVLRMAFLGINLLAVTGSVFGAFLSGLFFRRTKKIFLAWLGEILGTGIIGALVSYPVVKLFIPSMAESAVSPFHFIPFFVVATLIGGSVAYIFLKALSKTGVLNRVKEGLINGK